MTNWLRQAAVLARYEFKIQLRDRLFLILLFAVPTVLILVIGQALVESTTTGGTGLEQTVPGFGILFSFSVVTYTGLAFYRDVWWRTWSRTMTLPLPSTALVVGKCLPPFVFGVLQLLFLTVGANAVLGLEIDGSFLYVAVVIITIIASASMIGLFLTAITHRSSQLSQISYLIMILGGALGGAIAPFDRLPTWARYVGSAFPQRWGIAGLQAAIAGNTAVALENAAVLVGYCIVLLAVATRLLDLRKPKVTSQ